MTGWPWPLDAVQNFFEGMWTGLEQAFNSGINWLYNQLNLLITPISAALEGAGKTLWADLNAFLRNPVAAISSGLTWLKDSVADILSPLTTALEGASSTLWSSLNNFLRDPVNAISSGLTWLKDQTATMFDGAVAQIQSALGGALQAIPQAFTSALQSFWNWIVQNMSNTFSSVGAWLNVKVVQPVWSGMQWLWNWIISGVKGVFNTIVNTARAAANRIKAGDPTAALEVLTTFASLGLATQGIMSIAGLKVVGTGIEVGEIGHYVKDLLNPSMITGAVIGTLIGAAVRTPLTQYYNMMFRNQLPDENDLRTYFLRGYIDEDTARNVLARYGLADTWIDAEIKSWWIIPSVSDLINFVVREVITPDEFYDWAAKQGLSRYWAENYWEAHWQLPSFGNLREAFWRGIITEDEFRKYVVWHDYKPEPRPGISKSDQDIMTELSYELPGRIDARWMRRWGKITRKEFTDLLRKSGMHPDYVEKVADAYEANELLDERNRFATTLETLYASGKITEEEFRSKLAEIGFAEEEINLRAERAKYIINSKKTEIEADQTARITADEKRRLATVLEKLAYSNVITEDEFKTRLAELGFTEDEINLRLKIVEAQKNYLQSRVKPPEPKQLTTTELRYAWEFGLIDDETYKQRIEQQGYPRDDVELMFSVEQIRALRTELETIIREAMYDYRDGWLTREEFTELMNTLKLPYKLQDYWLARADMLAEREIRDEQYKIFLESFRLGIIDEETFRKELKELGMREDKIERVIYLEQLRKLGKT